MLKNFSLLILLICCIFLSPAVSALDLIKDGIVKAEILCDDPGDPVKKLAAGELQKYLFLLTGKEFTVTEKPTEKFPVKIFMGESIYTKALSYKMPSFRKSAFDIVIGKEYIILNGPSFIKRQKKENFSPAGKKEKTLFPFEGSCIPHRELKLASSDDPGIFYAVNAFLEMLGIRFYAPGMENTFLPERKNTLKLPEGRIKKESSYAVREYLYANGENFDKETFLWLKHLRAGSSVIEKEVQKNFLAGNAPAYYLRPHLQRRLFQQSERILRKNGKKFIHREFWHIPDMEESIKYFEYPLHVLPEIRKKQQKYFSGFQMLLSSGKEKTSLQDLPLRSLMIYINSKLLWDTNSCVEKILEEYCRNMYGEAAPEMFAFYKFAASVWERRQSRAMVEKDHFVNNKDLARFASILAGAKNRACGRKEILDRIELLEQYLPQLSRQMLVTPEGEYQQCSILPNGSIVDADEKKYKKKAWKITEDTQVFFAVTESRKELFVLLKCKNQIPEGKKFLFAVNTPFFSHFEVALDQKGNVDALTRDPEILYGAGIPEGFCNNLPVKKVEKNGYTFFEFVFPALHLGRGPTEKYPWGIWASFIGKEDKTAGKLPLKKEWKRLVAKSVDSKGRKLDAFNVRVVTPEKFNEPQAYIIRKTNAEDFLSSPWDGDVWGKANTAELAVKRFKAGADENTFCSKVSVKMLHDGKNIYGLFKVDDKYVKAVCTKDQGATCLDSCVEIFLRPQGRGSYYNFEFNCIGKLLCWEMEDYWRRLFDPLTEKELKSIQRFHTLKGIISSEIKEDTRWFLGFCIPAEIFVKRNQISLPLSGQIWTGAFMKCAQGTSNTTGLTWKKMETFHWPADFGLFIFE